MAAFLAEHHSTDASCLVEGLPLLLGSVPQVRDAAALIAGGAEGATFVVVHAEHLHCDQLHAVFESTVDLQGGQEGTARAERQQTQEWSAVPLRGERTPAEQHHSLPELEGKQGRADASIPPLGGAIQLQMSKDVRLQAAGVAV